ncbi:choice-of-anchor J family PEP-CTERM protein [Undibacterium terreum]|uniref:Ice-binding protein C-terminal domain-containing protein n=1 Tax=Undibacterium terreum TaxID=1224302 RepID=A0A916XEY2_9BURK|nr:choice-of-anchor J domain-containing protein [Undibacterium terreum]GGC68605.1 hypothetical protein GCM10011396_14560 [Undibacterium terreum]
MKFKPLLAGLAAFSLVASAQATDILSENFDSFSSLAGKGWVVSNKGQFPNPDLSASWSQGSPGSAFNSQSGAADSYAGVSYASAFGNVIDNWLFSPVFNLAAGETVTFYTRSHGDLPDRLQVSLSGNGASTNTSDFTSLLFDLNPTYTADGFPTDWFKVQFTIPTFSGSGTGRLGFRFYIADASANGDYIGLDTFSVVPEPATVMTLGIGMLGLLAMRRRNKSL